MTDRQAETKLWLNRAFYADQKARALQAYAKILAEEYKRIPDGDCKDGTQLLYEQTICELSVEIAQLMLVRTEVQDAIKQVGDDELECILYRRYLLFETYNEIAEHMCYSRSAIKYKMGKAIDIMQKFVPF